jgi:hypothetical protein
MRLANRPLLVAILLFFFVVLPLGLVEGWYGRVDYTTDAISYLDVARSIQEGHWKWAFNPLSPFFPPTGAGEWNLLHMLNFAVYAAAYATFIFCLRSLIRTFERVTHSPVSNRIQSRLILAGTAIFLCSELCLDNASRVGPDMLVSTFFLLAVSLVLRLLDAPNIRTFVLLGVVLGIAYVIKAIFLPLSIIIILVTGIALYLRREKMAGLALTILCAALFAVPYIAGLSWSYGHFTTGESGSVNYAWHVNKVTQIHWQGGPARFGKPIHPTTQLLANPPIYSFAEPFHVSYAPFFNPPYFYEGLRHVFIPKMQLRAIAANSLHLIQALRPLPIFYCILFCLALILAFKVPRSAWLQTCTQYWPLLLPALAGIALYLQVHLEGRYLPGFLLTLAVTPLAVFLLNTERWPAWLAPGVLAILWLGCAATILKADRTAINRAIHRTHYGDSEPWVFARFLTQHGLQPGDKVAVIGGPAANCLWAHVDHLRVVSELEVDLYAPPDTAINLYWNASPADQEKMRNIFASTGAKLLISRLAPSQTLPPGWIEVPGANAVVYDLQPTTPSPGAK